MNKLFKFYMLLAIPFLSVMAISCDDDTVDDDVSLEPTITGVSPEEGLPGASVTITGTNLENATVTFGSAEAAVTANTATSITTTVPATATAGSQNITVTTAEGSATRSFTVLAAQPDPITITAFDPAEGAVGDQITITGTNFDDANILTIWMGDVEITDYDVVDENTITFTVPEGAVTSTVTINLMQGDPVVSTSDFTVAGSGGSEASLYSNVVINAQGPRMDEGVVTLLNTNTGTTHHYTEPVDDEELAASVDFLLADTNGENNWAIFSPNPEGDAVWLMNNFYKEVEWPHYNTTMLRVLEDADASYFEDATAEDILALSIGENDDDHSGRINGLEQGDVILYQSSNGNKGLILFKTVNQATVEDYKDDIFTLDVKVVHGSDEE